MTQVLEKNKLFSWALFFSLLLHAGLWRFSLWRNAILISETPSMLEVDLTRPFRIVSDPRLAKRAVVSGTGAPMVAAPQAALPPAPAPAVKAQDWVIPGPKTTELVKPTTAENSSGTGGLGEGPGGGEVDWVYLTDLPKLLNREDLIRNMRRFYPPAEREAGREGVVALTIHINEEGRVIASEVATSGAAFDAAAKKVMAAARFSPARVGRKPVPVKMKQAVYFQLQEQ